MAHSSHDYNSDSHLSGQEQVLNAPGSESLALARPTAADPNRQFVEHLLSSLKDEVPEEGTSKRWSLSHYTAIIRRRWLPMLLAGLVVGGTTAVKLRPSDTLYGATSVMLLPARGNNSQQISDPFGVVAGLMKAAGPSNPTTQIAIITSPGLVETAISRLPKELRQRGFKTADPKAAANLAKVTAVAGDSADIINITVNALDPQAAVALANEIINTYATRSQDLANQANSKNLVVLAQQVKDSYKLMTAAKAEYMQYKTKHGVVDLGTKVKSTATAVEDIETRAASARAAVSAGEGDPSVQSDEQRLKLLQDLKAAKSRYEEVLVDFLPTAPEAIKAKTEVAEAESALRLRTESLLAINKSRLEDAEKSLAEVHEAAKNLPAIEVTVSQLQDKVDQLSNSYKQVCDRYTALSLGQNQQIDTANALTPADEAFPASRSLATILVVALVCGLATAALVAAIFESTDHSLHSPEDLSDVAVSPLLGSIPMLNGSQQRLLPQLQMTNPDAAVMLEASRILRSNLLFAAGEPIKSVLITSATSGEGKSLTAYNTAAAMAMDGRRVLILDCDLRRPSQHELVGCPPEPGLADVLEGTVSLDAALRPGGLKDLWVLTAGSMPSNPPELLGGEANRKLLAELQTRFDLVILDSPPILSLADAQVLASLADGVLLVVAADSTPKKHVQRTESLLRHVGAKVLGIAFNKVKHHQDADLWSSYYNYGGSKPEGRQPRALN